MTSTAGGGTLALEFGLLSRLTSDPGQNTPCSLKFLSESFHFSLELHHQRLYFAEQHHLASSFRASAPNGNFV